MLLAEIFLLIGLLIAMLVLLSRVPRPAEWGLDRRTRARTQTPPRAPSVLIDTAGAVHGQLRPLLREIAGARLARRGIVLDGRPEPAREALGPELWELVRPGRPEPVDRRGPGIERGELTRLIDRLEAL